MTSSPPGASAHQALWKRFLIFLGPLIVTNVLQALSGTLNSIYLGQLLGARTMAAAVSFFPLLMFCVAFVIGLGTGASILIGQAWGSKDLEKVRRIAGTVLVGGVLLGAGVGLIGRFLRRDRKEISLSTDVRFRPADSFTPSP